MAAAKKTQPIITRNIFLIAFLGLLTLQFIQYFVTMHTLRPPKKIVKNIIGSEINLYSPEWFYANITKMSQDFKRVKAKLAEQGILIEWWTTSRTDSIPTYIVEVDVKKIRNELSMLFDFLNLKIVETPARPSRKYIEEIKDITSDIPTDNPYFSDGGEVILPGHSLYKPPRFPVLKAWKKYLEQNEQPYWVLEEDEGEFSSGGGSKSFEDDGGYSGR